MPDPVATPAEITPEKFKQNCATLTRAIAGNITSHIRDLNFKISKAIEMLNAAPDARDNVPEIVALQLLDGAKAQCGDITAEIDAAIDAAKKIRTPPAPKQE